jgi:hypothetical protein
MMVPVWGITSPGNGNLWPIPLMMASQLLVYLLMFGLFMAAMLRTLKSAPHSRRGRKD